MSAVFKRKETAPCAQIVASWKRNATTAKVMESWTGNRAPFAKVIERFSQNLVSALWT